MTPLEAGPAERPAPARPVSDRLSAAVTDTPPPAEARRIGKYLVRRELGRGGMGAVYLAEQPGLGREVAIKELLVNSAADPTALTRFLQEAQVMARSTHPNIIQVHDLEQVGDANYIILEYVKGRSLRELMNQRRVPLPQVFAIMHAVLQGLDYAHRRAIVHRDMKPENVLMSDEGDVKVADFGIARLTDDSGGGSTATKTGTTVGTPQYMSPEQVSSSKVDGRSDLYSSGIMLYELICGRPPFTATEADGPFTLMAKHVQAPPPPPALHVPGLDMQLEEVILKALAKRPEERYQSGEEFDEALGRVADRLAPGWRRSLHPGADLNAMEAGAGAATIPSVAALPGLAATMPSVASMPGQADLGSPVGHPQPSPVPINRIYAPKPPVKAQSKKAGCLGVLTLLVACAGTLALAVVAALHP